MSAPPAIDVALAILFVTALMIGWRQGAVSSILAILGVVLGVVIGVPLAPLAMAATDNQPLKVLLGLGTVVILVAIGHAVGTVAGQSLRNAIRSPMAVGLDSSLGAIVQSVTALLVAWMIAVPLATAVPGPFADMVRESKGLQVVDDIAPDEWADVFGGIIRQLRDDGMPAIAPPFGYRQEIPDEPADPNVISQEVVDAIRPSIVRVMGEAPQCERLLQGTGFVVAPDLILTNAHVVAGTTTVRLETVVGMADANVVHYDPLDDVALLRTTDLPLEPMQWADQDAVGGADAVVLGFPESGPFTATPARVTEAITIRGPDIYSETRHERRSYVLNADVRHGNSGGPLITPQGQVLGLVFGAGVNNDQTGYALTRDEVQPHIDQAQDAYSPVATLACVAG